MIVLPHTVGRRQMIEMTSYEMLDLARSHAAGASEDFNRYLAMITAYLVTAYIVGRELTKVQVTIVNIGFVTLAAQSVFGMYQEVSGDIYWSRRAWGDDVDAFGTAELMYYSMGAVLIGGVLASVLFMWSVRHAKTE